MSAATQPSQPIDLAGELNLATVGDYFALLKPRVMSLVLFTGIAGLVLAPGTIHIADGAHRAALRSRWARARRARSTWPMTPTSTG